MKGLLGPFGNTGTINAVPGSASQISGGSLDHPVMERSLNILGSMLIDVVGRQLDARMIGVNGDVLDHFQLVKGPALPVCSDGIDQDGDGRFDFPSDSGCQSVHATLENPKCDDDLDNDGDGAIDWDGGAGLGTPDPQCPTPYRNQEAPSCGLGAELALAMAALVALERRRRRV